MHPQILTADSITGSAEGYRNRILVAGSHGGAYCGYLAARGGLRGVILNDAGVGRERAGIGALAYLDRLGMAAAAVAFDSARIGDGEDMLRRGIISHRNRAAARLGCAPGQRCREAAACLAAGPPFRGVPEPYGQARAELGAGSGGCRILACDSASLVLPEDAGQVVITGSHGGVLAGRPGYAIGAQVLAAVFNDAGVGIDEAGIRRLPLLERSGIAAVTAGAGSARIGDARSAWETGVVSHANARAARLGARPGMTVKAFVTAVLRNRGQTPVSRFQPQRSLAQSQ